MRQIYLSLEKQNLHLSVLQSTLPDLRKSMRIVWLGFISRILQSIILLCVNAELKMQENAEEIM